MPLYIHHGLQADWWSHWTTKSSIDFLTCISLSEGKNKNWTNMQYEKHHLLPMDHCFPPAIARSWQPICFQLLKMNSKVKQVKSELLVRLQNHRLLNSWDWKDTLLSVTASSIPGTGRISNICCLPQPGSPVASIHLKSLNSLMIQCNFETHLQS